MHRAEGAQTDGVSHGAQADQQCNPDRAISFRLALQNDTGATPYFRMSNTENTTAGSVGASAVPNSRATGQEKAKQQMRDHRQGTGGEKGPRHAHGDYRANRVT